MRERQEQARNQEEIRHAEGLRPGDEVMQPGHPAGGIFHAKGGMHEHHQHDANALGIINPADAALAWRHGNILNVPAGQLPDQSQKPCHCETPWGWAIAGPFKAKAPVAQMDRALPSEGRGQGFESLRVRQVSPL